MAGLPTDVQSAMDQVAELKQQIRERGGTFEELGGQVRNVSALDADEVEGFIRWAMTLLDELMDLLEQATGASTATNQARNEIGLRLTITQSELEREIEWLQELIDRLSAQLTGMPQYQSSTGILANITQRFLPWLQRQVKRLGSLIWKVVAGLLTPKEWKVSGQVAANIFGLGGNVGVEITFGS